MSTPARLLRANADSVISARPFLTPRELERRDIILRAGRTLMAEFGRHAFTLAEFANAIRIPAAAIRRHFADLDNLLGTLLRDHLLAVATALGTVPHDAPDRPRALRAAYLAATRTGLGAPTEAQLLLIRDRHLLPQDERASIEAMRDNIADIVAPSHAELTLALLDTPQIHPNRMEAALAATLAAPLLPDTAQPPLAAEKPAAPPARVAPFIPRIRPLPPKPAEEAVVDWPAPSLWEHAPPPPERVNGFHGNDLKEALRRASS